MPSAEFYFDVVHPYCFLALPAVAAAQERGWLIEYRPWEKRPAPAPLYAERGDYLRRDWLERVYPAAIDRNVEIHLPTAQPRSTLACAAFLGYRGGQRTSLLNALFEAFFVQGLNLCDDLALAHAAENAGIPIAEVWTAAYAAEVRSALATSREAAVVNGVLEIPALLVSGEKPVIGLADVEARLARD